MFESGLEVWIRPIVPQDADHIRHALETADDETLYRRFFTTSPQLDEADIDRLARVDYHHRLALVAFSEGKPVAVARYESSAESPEAEIAFAVDPDFQAQGLATHLGRLLIQQASEKGKERIVAYYLATNEPAARLLARLGLSGGNPEHGVVDASLELSPIPS